MNPHHPRRSLPSPASTPAVSPLQTAPDAENRPTPPQRGARPPGGFPHSPPGETYREYLERTSGGYLIEWEYKFPPPPKFTFLAAPLRGIDR